MEEFEQEQAGETMQLRQALLIWFSCLVIWIGMLVLSAYASFLGGLSFFFYLGAGLYLNKAVLPKLIEWHPMYNTLHNVTSEKLKLFLAWPITYFILLMKLGVNKLL